MDASSSSSPSLKDVVAQKIEDHIAKDIQIRDALQAELDKTRNALTHRQNTHGIVMLLPPSGVRESASSFMLDLCQKDEQYIVRLEVVIKYVNVCIDIKTNLLKDY